MDELNLIYEAVGSDPEKVLARFGGNEEMLRHFLRLFAKDDCFANLQAALAAGNTADAFRAVHTLKGVSASLRFTKLYTSAGKMTELLRSASDTIPADSDLLMDEIHRDYELTVTAIRNYLDSRNSFTASTENQ